jgi:serine/threonine-protein kinase
VADYEALQIGQTFAERYRVEKFLAKGGFGAVYIAEQIETELKVALKVLWPHVLHSTDAVEKFRLEARVAGRVNSEHIVKVFDAGFDSGSGMPFLVMELLRGAELDKVVETHGPLPPARAVNYLRQIAAGLDRAHGYVTRDGVKTPIVHRDLKPENLFLADRENGEQMIKILDFGIAKVLTESTNVSQEVKGTPLYMAFEQVAAGKITPQTDIWPLGLITFFLLTGKAYWKSANHGEATITQLFGEVLSLPIEPASQRARELGVAHVLPPAFDAWFARCVERVPSNRFATAGECAQALAEALSVSAGATQVSALPQVNVADSGAAAAAQTLGRTTAAPLVTRSEAASKPRGGVKWLLALGLLGLVGAAAAQRLLRPTPLASESVSAVAPPAPSPAPAAPVSAVVALSSAAPAPALSAAIPPIPSPPMSSATSVAAAAPHAAVPALHAGKPAAAAAAATPASKPAAAKPDLYGDR